MSDNAPRQLNALPTEEITTEQWCLQEGPLAPGWIPGAFTIVLHGTEEKRALGWFKESFGVFEAFAQTNMGMMRISSLVHIRSYMKIGVFHSPETAAAAGEIAESIGAKADWSTLNAVTMPLKKWQGMFGDIQREWRRNDIVPGPSAVLNGDRLWMAVDIVPKILKDLGTKVHAYMMQHPYGKLQDLEIVLGFETNKIVFEALREQMKFGMKPGEKPKGPGTFSGAKLNGMEVVVDSSTPRLWTVRPKQGLRH